MSIVSVIQDNNAWQVWISLEDGTKAPYGLSFIIGSGTTRDEALSEAVADLEEKIAQLQGPPQ